MARSSELAELEEAWQLSDELFHIRITEDKALSRPISLRNPFVFYFGHLPSFAWNTIRTSLTPSPPPMHNTWDSLFSRGMDPDVEDPTKCHDHPAPPPEWPKWKDVAAYSTAVRHAIRDLACSRNGPSARVLHLVAEHEVMHVETLYYMLAQSMRTTDCDWRSNSSTGARSSSQDGASTLQAPRPPVEWVKVQSDSVALGAKPGRHFVWDNEADVTVTHVEDFSISRYAVSISHFEAFVRAGGYNCKSLWTEEDWAWIKREGLSYPSSWGYDSQGRYIVITGTGPGKAGKARTLEEASSWPVSVSLAEARAFAAWIGASVPSEPQWMLAAYGAEGGTADTKFHNVMTGEPGDVRDGKASHCGAIGMVGNGWELTATVFDRFDGFEPTPEYPEYSVDFFDGKHFVLKGASWATHPMLVRSSFRNFYQARYPFVFSKFRLARGK